MRRLGKVVLLLATISSALASGTARAQAPAAPPPPAPTVAPPPSQAADTEQPAASRQQTADTEQPVRLRQRNGTGGGGGRRHVGLLVGGLITLGVSYGISAGAGAQLMSMSCANCKEGGERLLIPIVGPWAALPDSASAGKPLLAILGVVQAAGLIMTIAGAVNLNSDRVPDDPRDPRDVKPPKQPPQWRSNGRLSLLVLPTGDGAAGVVAGSF